MARVYVDDCLIVMRLTLEAIRKRVATADSALGKSASAANSAVPGVQEASKKAVDQEALFTA